jgi:O-antigen/teichoic acid export membrane protein
MAAAMAIPLAVFARPFLGQWIAPEFADRSGPVMVLLVFTYALLGLTGVAWGPAFGAGRAKANALFALFMGFSDVALLFLLVDRYEVLGAAIAYFISAAVGVPALIVYVERQVLGLRGGEFLLECGRVLPAVVFQALLGLALRHFANDLPFTIAGMALTAVALPILYLLSGLATQRDRALAGSLVRQLTLRFQTGR